MKVVIVEDQRLYLDAVAEALKTRSIEVAGRATTFDEALQVINESACDVALLDVSLPPDYTDEGLRIAEAARRSYPDVGLVILSGYAKLSYVERLINIGGAQGAVGYLLKERVGNVNELAATLTRVAAGEVAIDHSFISTLMKRRRRADPIEALSPQQRRILALVAEGRSNLRIAQELNLKINTVEKNLTAITSSLGLPVADDPVRREVNVRVLATLAFLRRGGAPVTEPDRAVEKGAPQ